MQVTAVFPGQGAAAADRRRRRPAAKSKARGGGAAAAAGGDAFAADDVDAPIADLSDGLKRQNDEFLAEMKAAAQLGLPPAL